jgi:hypothetical protein
METEFREGCHIGLIIQGKSKAFLHATKRMQTTYRETPRGQESTQPQITYEKHQRNSEDTGENTN